MGYGRKIINYLFKKREVSPAICYEFERKVQADSDRSDIQVFETGISTQRYGDNWQSPRDAEETECNRLISIAKENRLFIDKSEWANFGDKRSVPSSESVVFLSKDESTYTKIKFPFAKAPIKHTKAEDFIYKHLTLKNPLSTHNTLIINTQKVQNQ